jgi:hypothetical protein
VSAIDSYVADLAFEHDLSLPIARKLASLAIYALDDSHDPSAPAALADPDVAWTYVQGPLGIYADDASAERLDELARDVIARGFDTAGAWFARGCVAERRGEPGSMMLRCSTWSASGCASCGSTRVATSLASAPGRRSR